jgi:hypothetical protein
MVDTNSMASRTTALLTAIAGCGLVACVPTSGSTTPAKRERAPAVVLEMSHGVPIGRDEQSQALLRIDVFEGDRVQVAVPYLYGYPLYSEQGGHVGIRKLRHENWEGYERSERSEEGVVHVRERFPALGCTFEGVQEAPQRYVPLAVRCEVPPPEPLGGRERSVVGAVKAGASAQAVRAEPSLEKAFLGEWHATTPGFEGKSGVAYFATSDGLLGFGFERGGLSSISFHFDPPHEQWRRPELWAAPAR